ncbi:MAG: carbohydrate ABC transporter permease [Bacillota bacterium]
MSNTHQGAKIEYPRRRWRLTLRLRGYMAGYWMVAPAVALYVLFILYPIFRGLFISLHDWNVFSPMTWVGLQNYRLLLRDDIFRRAIANNVIYAVAVTVSKNALGFLLAVLVNAERLRGRTFFRTILFMPVTMSFVVVGLLWSWIYNPLFGLLNASLKAMGLGFLIRDWLSDPGIALWSIILVDTWKWLGFHMVILLAGLQSIPTELYEAAYVDGASSWRQFWGITVPLMMPVLTVSVMLSLMGAFVRNFDLVYVMTGGGPAHVTEVVLTWLHTQAFGFARMGYGAAMGFMLFVVVFIFSMVVMRSMRTERLEF